MTGNGRGGHPRGLAAALLRDVLLTALAITVDVMASMDDGKMPGGVVLPVCTAVVMGTLLFRRRFPVAVLAVQVGYGILVVALVPDVGLIAGLLVGLYAVASRREPAWSAPGLFATAAVIVAQVVSSPELDKVKQPELILLFQGLLLLGVWGAGYRAWTARMHLNTLAAEQRDAKARALRDERLRIARELHDIVAGSVSVMVVQAAGAQTVLHADPHRVGVALGVIQHAGTQAMAELRRLLGLLRSAGEAGETGDDATAGPGVDGIEELLDSMRNTGLTISYRTAGTPAPIDPSVSLACYRIVQESLTNTVKHAGPDAAIDVHLAWHRDSLTLNVANHGGHRPADAGLSTGHGLLGLRERVGTLGGVFTAGPTADGFTVHAELPVANSAPLIPARV
ncbi:sensor histidine kinase [Paractinoplanes durhamensis]|uniref:histidine kinase n=1 Tax=Paractinoplanes durhamensis TaxID=113563 RepID=A0ABQ3YXZ2_9ACTN|nr:histidine kinase [Actinoplanes durhamensis]GIE02395.1 two-component sensor histidine kinase [Actinoplanes durhamensis]